MKRIVSLVLILTLLLCLGACGEASQVGTTQVPTESTETPQTTLPETEAPTSGTEAQAATEAPRTEAPAAAPETEAPTKEPATEAPVTEAPATESPTETPEPVVTPKLDVWEMIEDAMYREGSFTDSYGYEYTYSFELPRFTLDTPAAREINADLDSSFGADAREALDAIDRKLAPGILSMGYYTSVWEDVVALIAVEHTDWDWDGYKVYCYDTTNDAWLSTPQLLEKMGYSQEEFLEAARTANLQAFEDQYRELSEEIKEENNYYAYRDKATSQELINLNLQAFPDPYGDIQIVAPVPSMAGADYYPQLIYLALAGEG